MGKPTTCGHEPHKAKGLCKKCYNAAYNAANREQQSARSKAWRVANPDKKAAYLKVWQAANPDKVAVYSKAWRSANPDKVAAYSKAWREANCEKRAATLRAWWAVNPDKRKNAYHKRRALKLGAVADLTGADWRGILNQFDHSCFYCGASDIPLQQEHMTPISRGGRHTASNVVPACQPCNGRKHTKTAEEFLGLGRRCS